MVDIKKCFCGELSENYKLRRIECKNGAVQYVIQCVECGQKISNPIPHKSLTLDQKERCELYDYDFQKEKRIESFEKLKVESEFEREEKKQKYREYLQSDEWKEIRLKRLNIDEHKCQWCGEFAVQVHHLHYRNIFEEKMEDLVSVCLECHEIIHAEFVLESLMWFEVIPKTIKNR